MRDRANEIVTSAMTAICVEGGCVLGIAAIWLAVAERMGWL